MWVFSELCLLLHLFLQSVNKRSTETDSVCYIRDGSDVQVSYRELLVLLVLLLLSLLSLRSWITACCHILN